MNMSSNEDGKGVYKEKPTIEMCFHKAENGDPCQHKPEWKLKGDTKRFKVCDLHLAWGIRFCGFPALVDKFTDGDTRKTKEATTRLPKQE